MWRGGSPSPHYSGDQTPPTLAQASTFPSTCTAGGSGLLSPLPANTGGSNPPIPPGSAPCARRIPLRAAPSYFSLLLPPPLCYSPRTLMPRSVIAANSLETGAAALPGRTQPLTFQEERIIPGSQGKTAAGLPAESTGEREPGGDDASGVGGSARDPKYGWESEGAMSRGTTAPAPARAATLLCPQLHERRRNSYSNPPGTRGDAQPQKRGISHLAQRPYRPSGATARSWVLAALRFAPRKTRPWCRV